MDLTLKINALNPVVKNWWYRFNRTPNYIKFIKFIEIKVCEDDGMHIKVDIVGTDFTFKFETEEDALLFKMKYM